MSSPTVAALLALLVPQVAEHAPAIVADGAVRVPGEGNSR